MATNLTGTAASLTAGNVTANANLTGPITSVGNATSIASQTGTGTKFVVDTSPTLVTPVLGVASATSINKVAITAPASSATLVIADGKTATHNASTTFAGTDGKTLTISNSGTLSGGDAFVISVAASKTLTVSNTITITATDGSTLAIGTGGTLASAAHKATGTSGNTVPLLDGTNTWSGNQTVPSVLANAAYTTAWGFDGKAQTVALSASSSSSDIASGSGLLIVISAVDGSAGVYSVGGTLVTGISTVGAWVAPTTSPGASKCSVAWSGSGYRIYTGSGANGTYSMTMLRAG